MAGEGWTVHTVDELKSSTPNALATGPFGSAISSRHFTDRGVPVIRGSNLSQDVGIRLRDEGLVFVAKEKAKEFSRSLARRGDLVFTCWGTIDQVGLIDARSEFTEYVVSNKQMKLTPDPEKASSLFLYYLFSSPLMRDRIISQGIGSSVPGFNLGQLRSLTVTLPPLGEQRAIAQILGTLDDKIELNQRMNETLEAMARALFKSWFVDFDPVRAKVEGRDAGLAKELADLFPDSFEDSDLGDIPKGWRVLPLAECVDAARGLSYKGSGLSDSGLPMHNLNSIYEGGGYKHEGIKHYKGDYRPHHVARAGDLIVANTEQGHDRLLIGYAAIVPARFDGESLFSHHLYRLRPKSSCGLTPDYLCHLLNTSVMHDTVSGYANGTTVNMLPIDGLQSPLVVVPPSVIVRAFGRFAERAGKRHGEMTDESRTLSVVRDTLLPKLVSGELQVKDIERITVAAL